MTKKIKLDENLNIIHDKETILCSAIWIDDGIKRIHQAKNINSGFVICGRRHHNCFRTIEMIYSNIDDFIKLKKENKVIQGFLTQTDRFVDRKEAMKIAQEANQILLGDDQSSNITRSVLISECIW